MSRYTLQTVTLPVLVDAVDTDNVDGWGSFPKGTIARAVNVVRPDDARKLVKASKGKEREVFIGLEMLRHAYESRDPFELDDANERVRPFISSIPGGVSDDVAKRWALARWDYSEVMSAALSTARLVMWWTTKSKRLASPALYCPDMKTAAFAMLYVGSVRLCPKCKVPFVPLSDNVEYCSPAHGVAHRTARSRRRGALLRASERIAQLR